MEKNKRNTNKIKKAVILMFKDKIIAKINEEIRKETQKLKRPLTKEEKNRIIKKVEKAKLREVNRKIAVGALATAIGITGISLLASGEAKENETEGEDIETVETTKNTSFKESLKVDNKENYVTEENTTDISKEIVNDRGYITSEIYNLSSQEEVVAWLKDFYIEEYESVTGDEKLTTADIKILGSAQSYVWDLGEHVVTHGANPKVTESLLKPDEKECTVKRDLYVYTVRLQDGTIIDAVTEDGKPVIPGDQYGDYKLDNSVAKYMGDIFNAAYEMMGNEENRNLKQELVDAVLEWKKEKQDREANQAENEASEKESGRQENAQLEDEGR